MIGGTPTDWLAQEFIFDFGHKTHAMRSNLGLYEDLISYAPSDITIGFEWPLAEENRVELKQGVRISLINITPFFFCRFLSFHTFFVILFYLIVISN